MSVQKNFKNTVKSVLAAVDLEVRRLPPRPHSDRLPVPPLHEDFLCALHDVRGGKQSSFRCPLEKVVDYAGFGFGKDKWHPFVMMLQMREKQGDTAAEAFLDSFYTRHQPRNAAEALIGFDAAPDLFRQYEAHLFYLRPWSAHTPEETARIIESWVRRDNAAHGGPELDLHSDGFPMFGPVSDAKQHLEYNRLRSVVESLKENGYDRSFGDCNFRVIKRGDDYRFICTGGGYHRTAAMAALGYDWVPGRIHPKPFVFDCADVDYWPKVRQGVWTKRQALAYVDYLFNYNSRDWYVRNMTT